MQKHWQLICSGQFDKLMLCAEPLLCGTANESEKSPMQNECANIYHTAMHPHIMHPRLTNYLDKQYFAAYAGVRLSDGHTRSLKKTSSF